MSVAPSPILSSITCWITDSTGQPRANGDALNVGEPESVHVVVPLKAETTWTTPDGAPVVMLPWVMVRLVQDQPLTEPLISPPTKYLPNRM